MRRRRLPRCPVRSRCHVCMDAVSDDGQNHRIGHVPQRSFDEWSVSVAVLEITTTTTFRVVLLPGHLRAHPQARTYSRRHTVQHNPRNVLGSKLVHLEPPRAQVATKVGVALDSKHRAHTRRGAQLSKTRYAASRRSEPHRPTTPSRRAKAKRTHARQHQQQHCLPTHTPTARQARARDRSSASNAHIYTLTH